MELEPSLTRRTFVKRSLQGLGGLFVLGSFTGGYTRIIEPFWLKVVRKKLVFPHLPKSLETLRLLHFTDIHYLHPVDYEFMTKVFDTIQSLEPDLICFTGDIADHSKTPIEELTPLLQKLEAPLGKYAVIGNHDGRHQRLDSVWKQSHFIYLKDDHHVIRHRGERIVIAGIEYVNYIKQTTGPVIQNMIQKALQGVLKNDFTILLSHYPDYADEAKHFSVDLQLSGHSHGGQVRFPFIGPVYFIHGAEKYYDGLYEWEDHSMKLYVDRGIGCAKFPVRFFCRPQVTLIELSSE